MDEFCAAAERFHFRYNTLPTREQFNAEFGLELSQEKFDGAVGSSKFRKYAEERGLNLSRYATPDMIKLADALLDPTIPTTAAKLKWAGVSIGKYNSLKNNQTFLSLLRERTDRLPESARSEVITALTKQALGGNVPAMKLWLEMHGEYTPNQKVTVEVDHKQTIGIIVELVQKYLSYEKFQDFVKELEAVITGVPGPNTPKQITATYERDLPSPEIEFDFDYDE